MIRMLSHEIHAAGCVLAAVNGYVDHVHLLVGLSRTTCTSDLVKSVKSRTSSWAKKTEFGVSTFQWQAGYGAFSVSHSNRNTVAEYIRKQWEHHRDNRLAWKEEFRRLCEKHEVEIDERYVWD